MFIAVFFLFVYVVYKYIPNQQQQYNTEVATTSDNRWVQLITSNFTMIVSSLHFFRFIIDNLILYCCICLIRIRCICIYTEAATTTQYQTAETASTKSHMLLIFRFQDRLCLCWVKRKLPLIISYKFSYPVFANASYYVCACVCVVLATSQYTSTELWDFGVPTSGSGYY